MDTSPDLSLLISFSGLQRPQPKWAVLQFLNFVVIVVFTGSITYVAMQYQDNPAIFTQADGANSVSPLTNMFFPLMVLWSCCLAYFFGFFGISFLDKEALRSSPSRYGFEDFDVSSTSASAGDETIRDAGTPGVTVPVSAASIAHAQHFEQGAGFTPVASTAALQPRNDTLICSDRKDDAVPAAVAAGAAAQVKLEELTDEEILDLLLEGAALKDYQLEKKLGDYERAVKIRRMLYERLLGRSLNLIPYAGYDYGKVFGANCEIVLGYVPIPVGIVGEYSLRLCRLLLLLIVTADIGTR